MLIWKGAGILVPVIAIGILMVMQTLVNRIFSDTTYYRDNEWPGLLAILLASSLIWLLGRLFNRSAYQNTTIKIHKQHTFFFIAFEHWAYIVAALGLLLYFL